MPKPLTELETESVKRMLARIQFAAHLMQGDGNDWDTPVPIHLERPLSIEHDWIYNPRQLARVGAHHLAIAIFGKTLLQDKEAQAALLIAISALWWEENDVAEEWALRSLKKLEAEIANVEEIPLWHAPELDILELAKVFRKLGRTQEEELLRRHLKKLLPSLQTGRDAGMDAVRLAVELGYDQEAEALALKLPPLVVGHSRGQLTNRLFRTLLLHNKQILAWALFAMTTEAHDEASLRNSAVEAACEKGDFELALKFSANDGHAPFQDSPTVVTIANWLIYHHRTHEWRAIWAMLTEQKFGLYHRFSTENQLKFLAKLVEHADPKDRKEIFKISNRIQQAWATSPNSELAQEIANIHLVIAAWGASKPTVRKLLKEAKIPKHQVSTVLRAAAARGLPGLLALVPEAQSKFLIQDSIIALRVEWELKQRGKRNRLEKIFYESLRKAITTNDQAMLYNIKTFVGRTWKDLELYRALIEKYPSYLGPAFEDIGPFTKPHVAAGDLLGLESELLKISDAQCLSQAIHDLYSCLWQRFGLAEELENF
jgi:hypothetical protein